jgi:bifunctional DNA primase/polymerase-like protein
VTFPLTIEGRSLPIFPVRGKEPACYWKTEATADPRAQLALWCRTYRPDGVALATGTSSGIDVLDIDPGGLDWLYEQRRRFRLPRTRTIRTRRGYHFYLRHAEGMGGPRSHTLDAFAINIKADGGYVVSPPSPGYEVFDDALIAAWPRGLIEWIDDHPQRDGSPSISAPGKKNHPFGDIRSTRDPRRRAREVLTRVENAKRGERRDVLLWGSIIFGAMCREGVMAPKVAYRLLSDAQRLVRQGREGWTTEQLSAAVHQTILDGLRYGNAEWKPAETTITYTLKDTTPIDDLLKKD